METLFIDLDGTLADFDTQAISIFGCLPHEAEERLGEATFWNTLRDFRDSDGNGFFLSLKPLDDALYMFETVKHLSPVILTGCPRGGWAEAQKVEWADRYFPKTKVITCKATDKILHMQQGDILIDDREKHRAKWENAGGIWITHRNAANSLATLFAIKPDWRL